MKENCEFTIERWDGDYDQFSNDMIGEQATENNNNDNNYNDI
jgi:hypothetical protein